MIAQSAKLNQAIFDDTILFEEKNGFVAVEAEHFYKQSKSQIRQWFRVSTAEVPSVDNYQDTEHSNNASNQSYIEILPDTRITHADKLVCGDNFSDKPGVLGIVHYQVKINSSGRYYVWVRAFSTGSEDNGIHVGINNTWPLHGQKMQWCEGKNKWTWASKQRTKEVHCGVPNEIYLDFETAGIHDIQFSMREDGFEFDKFILTKDINYSPM
ncbi:hypothetical protein [Algibacter amylolyticus]|uniref:hypothetical protein n=1 Tax=Algibacter amylolyticus TaxID=1608400 RepID=UPI001820F33A|nr:hypothetical protein [Algibacter amylolyticus]MBB5268954.1 hypothetical protein [Algibacter amylolyticus]